MILRRKGPTLLCLLLLQLTLSNSQNARSYDTSDWIPIPQPCSDCKSNDHVIEKKATGRVLNLPERILPDEYRNVRQTNNYPSYLTESGTTTKQKQRSNNKGYVQSNGQYELPQNHQLTPAQLQQAYTSQHLLPNIDLITRQVLQQSAKIAQQIQPAQALGQNQYQIASNQYNPALVQQNLLRQQNYPAVPQQFLLPQQLQQQQQQAQYYQQQGFIQQPQLQNFQIAQLPKQEVQNINQTSTLYDSAGIQNLNHELLNDAGQGYRTVDITSTTPKTEKENVQLLYVPLEHLQQKQQPATKTNLQSQKRHRHKPPTEPLKKENLLESIEQDFIQQALQAHRFQEELDQPNFYSPTSPPTTTTLKSVSRKRRPHQPPLAVYMNGAGNPKITDVLNALKDAKTIDVQDTIGPESPHVFVGPANLDPPQGFTKYELPYLSSIESNRIERKVDQLPFFVAPLNYKTPAGYSKIPFPSPHVGSVVINNNELERSRPLEAVPSVEDFLNPYQIAQSEPIAEVKQKAGDVNIKPISDEDPPVYYIRKPTKTRSRQQSRTRTPSNIVAEQTIQSGPSVNYINNYDTASNKQNENNLYNTNTFPVVSSTVTPNYQPNVEINNPSLNLSNQFRGQIATNQYLTYDQNGGLQEQQPSRQKVNQYDLATPTTYQKENKQNLQSANPDYYSEISNVTPQSSLPTGGKHQQSSTPKYDSNFEILPSVSSTISPFNTKDGTQDFFKELANFQATSIPSNANYYQDYNSRSNDQNQKRPIDQNVEDIFFNNKQSNNQQSANNDRRYLPLDSQPPPAQIDYEDVFQLPLSANQLNTDQKQITTGNEASSRRQSKENIARDENYKNLEQYPVHSTSPALEEQVPTRQPNRQRTRGRTHDGGENRAHLQQIPQENYELLPISDQQVLPEKNLKTNVNNYGNNFPENPQSPVENPVLPGLINSLEDPSIRQLLTPILLAPPEKLKTEIPLTTRPTQAPIAYDHYSQTLPFDINYNYDQISTSTTTTETPSSTQSAIQFETTTQRRQRNRGRGSSRYNDRTTTSSPRRNPAKIRTQHPSRNRFRQSSTTTTTTTTEAYIPIKHPIYTTTTETVKRIPTRQKFRTRGRPLQSEFYSSTPGFKINRTPETTTPQVAILKEEPEAKIEVQHEFYEEQPVKKPQLITRSKILTPEEEYLVNKYNLQVTTIDDPITDNIQVLSQNVQEELPEQRLDGSKAIEVQQVYRTTSTSPIITELELTTRRVIPPKQTYLTKHNIGRNQIRTEHTPVKIRTRIRARKTTQRPTTTTTTTVRNMLSSASSIEEQEQDFYGFFRQPAFSTPRVETTVKTPYQGKSLYNPIIIGHPNSDLYEDEDVEINDDGVQIFTNNQYSSSTPVHFIGELLPKQVTTEKYYEATYEPLPPADRYISASTSTTTQEPKRKLRLPSRKNQQEETQRINSIQQSESISRRAPQRTRTRGRSSYKLPNSVTSERSTGNDNYPELYLKAKSDNQQYDPQSAKTDSPQSKAPIQQTEKPSFQITIDPGDGEEDGEDQEPYSSILRPKVLPLASNHWVDQDKTKGKDEEQITIATEPSTVVYETTTNNQEKIESTTMIKEEVAITHKSKKRGYWKLVKTKKITDDFEVAESQNVGVVSLNSFGDDNKQKQSSDDFSKKGINLVVDPETSEAAVNVNHENEEDFVNSLYTMFGLTTVTPINETITDSSETTESSSIKEPSPSETPTTATPLMPEEFETTTSDNQDYLQDSILEDNSDLDDVSINEDEDWGLGVVETSTSTSTEISHETEICYKGVCVKSNEMK